MDEQNLLNQQQTQQPVSQTPQTAAPAMSSPATEPTTPLATPAAQQNQYPVQYNSTIQAQPAQNLPEGVSDYSAQIQQMYEAQMAAKAQSLQDAYNQSLEEWQHAKDQIAPQFIAQGNDLATQYERTRRNNNIRADLNGLNTGAASQMDLAQQSNYLNSFGKIRAAQATAEAETDRQIANLETAYKSAVAQALADNDYQKATALLQEYQRRDAAAEEMRRYNQAQAEADAKLRAAYGDFGGYAEIYGQEVANQMRDFFLQANPDYAWANGLMDANKYKKLTGRYPAGYSVPSSGSGSGSSLLAKFEQHVRALKAQGASYSEIGAYWSQFCTAAGIGTDNNIRYQTYAIWQNMIRDEQGRAHMTWQQYKDKDDQFYGRGKYASTEVQDEQQQ